jgi:diguanylate cyclase (GGDEF)-like protein/PAS domain S-box-containing protein
MRNSEKRTDENCRKALAVFDSLDMAVYVSDPETFEILYINQAVKRHFGEVVGEKCHRAFHRLDAPCSFCTNDIILNRRPDRSHVWEFYNRLNRRWYRCIDKAIEWIDGRTVRYEMAVDITDLKEAEAALRESEERYRTILAEIEDGYYEVDLKGRFVLVNDALCRAMGYSADELIGMDYRKYTDAKKAEKISHAYNQVYCTGKPKKSLEWEIAGKNGRTMTVAASVSLMLDAHGNAVGFRGIVRDISLQKRVEKTLKRQSFQDELTGLANRRRFDEDLQREINRARRGGLRLSLLLSDIDCFKGFNDQYGHLAGDNCLKQVASALTRAVYREGDLVTRYGGEEFATILPQTDIKGAVIVAERIRQNVMDLNIYHGKSTAAEMVTVSTGVVSLVPSLETTPFQLIAGADKALYRAKKAGRNQYQTWNEKNDLDESPARFISNRRVSPGGAGGEEDGSRQ